MPERTLDRLIRIGLAAVVLGVVAIGVIYFLDRQSKGASLVDRQISAAEQAVRSHPTNVGLRLELADIYRAADRSGDALAQYDAVLGVEKHQDTALLGRGEILAEQGQGDEAAAAFRKVIGKADKSQFADVNPTLEAAYYGLGSLQLEEGAAKQARQAAQRAVKIEPGDADAWYLLGSASLASGAAKPAVKALQEAVLFVPTGWCDPYERLVDAYRALHNSARARYAAAMVDFCDKRLADATRKLKSLTSGPAAVDAMLGLGMVAEAESHRAGAKRWYRKVLAADPGNFNAQSGLTRLSAHSGEE